MANKAIDIRTFEGGMNKDVDEAIIKANQYRHAENFKLIVNEDSSGFTLENAEGNSEAIDLTDLTGIDNTYQLQLRS